MDWHTQRPASRSKHRAHTYRTWESESPEILNGEFKMAFFQVNVGQKLKWHRQATPASADVCCLKCLRRIVINQLHLVLPALLWCPLTHYHWCTATDKVHNTHTQSQTVRQGNAVRTRTSTLMMTTKTTKWLTRKAQGEVHCCFLFWCGGGFLCRVKTQVQ